jgi:hypothetical protein
MVIDGLQVALPFLPRTSKKSVLTVVVVLPPESDPAWAVPAADVGTVVDATTSAPLRRELFSPILRRSASTAARSCRVRLDLGPV